MKKKILMSLILVGILATGCVNKKEEKNSSEIIKSVVVEKTIKDIEIKKGTAYEKGTDKKYSGPVAENYGNGNIKIRTNYSQGLKEGAEEMFYEDGNLSMRSSFIKGKLEGARITYTKTVQSYNNGTIEEAKTYHTNGNLNTKTSYIKGKIEGTVESYFENGKIRSKSEFKNGKREGVTEIYNNKGELQKKDIYKDNKVIETKN